MRVPIRGVHCTTAVGAVLLLSLVAGPVQASGTVSATFSGIQSGTGATDVPGGGGGVFNWTLVTNTSGLTLGTISNAPTNNLGTGGASFQTFCLETLETVNNNPYTVQTEISAAPVNNHGQFTNGMGAAAAKNIELLFGKFYYNSTDGYATSASTGIASGIDYAALQLAIWTIVNHSNGTLDPLSPDPYPIDSNNTATVLADYGTMINYLNTSAAQNSGPLADYLVALTSPDNQDQLGINVGGSGTPFAVPTPCPPGIVLSLIGIVGMGGYGWRRRRLLGR